MGIIGPRASVDLALPSGIDTSRIFNFQNRSGMNAQEIISRAAAAIGEANEAVMARWQGMIFMTKSLFAYYAQGSGSRTETPVKTEFKRADGVRSDASGHMLPFRDFEDALSWTPLYLRDAYEEQINADVSLIGDRWFNRVDKEIVTRILTTTENAIGTGYDVPWAIGTGTNVNFIPTQYGTNTFTSSHTHFYAAAGSVSATSVATMLDAMVLQLRHHGHSGTLVALVSETDLASYTGIANGKFIRFIPNGVQTIAGATTNPVLTIQGELEGMPGTIFGWYLSDRGLVELRYHDRFPTGYAFMTKSYGNKNPRNGVAVREHPDFGFGLRVAPQVSNDINPELEFILFKGGHGMGVNNRLNGVAGYIGNASYQNPTIS